MIWAFSRQLVAWHRPFCVDLEESTFTYLRNFLESYCDGIESDAPPAPFLSKRYEANTPSVLIILYNLLWDHIIVSVSSVQNGLQNNVLCAVVSSLHHHEQEDSWTPTHFLFLSHLMLSVCVPQGPPPVSFAVHEAAVHPLVPGPRWGYWCNGFGGSGQASQKPAV